MGISYIISSRSSAEGAAAQGKRRRETGTDTNAAEGSRHIDQNTAGLDLLPKSYHGFLVLSIYDSRVPDPLVFQDLFAELHALILILDRG